MSTWLLFLTLPSYALDAPSFDPDQPVHVVPTDHDFRTQRIVEAVELADYPTYVVVYEHVLGEGLDGWSSATERAVEETWSAWTPHPDFNPAESFVVVLALDDREVRVLSGSRWDAAYGLHGEKLGQLIDESFMPLAIARDLEGGLAELVLALDEATAKALAREAARERMASQAKTVAKGIIVAIPLVSLALGFLAWWWVGVRARRRYEEAEAEQRAALARAEGVLSAFTVDVELRDQLVALRLKGPKTTALLAGVTSGIDDLRDGLRTLQRRIDAVDATTEGLSDLRAGAWKAARADLDGPVRVERDDAIPRLFDGELPETETELSTFEDTLVERFEDLYTTWELLLDAAEAAGVPAATTLPPAELDELKERLDTIGAPRSWLASHPLAEDVEATLDALDALRTADPVDYLQQLEAAEERADAVEALVQHLEGLSNAIGEHEAKLDDLPVDGLDTVIDLDRDDPLVAAAEVDRASEALQRAIDAGTDLEAVDAAGAALLGAIGEQARRHRAIREAVDGAHGSIVNAEREVARLTERYTTARARLDAAGGAHAPETLAGAEREAVDAQTDLEEARTALGLAKAALGDKRHVAAARHADEAVRELTEATTDLQDLSEILDRLTEHRTSAQDLYRQLDAARRTALDELTQADGSASSLKSADQLRVTLEQTWSSGPADWAERERLVKEILSGWRSAVTRARATQRALREAARAAARAAESRRRASSSFGSSSRRTTTSSWSSSSRSSWGSSSSSRSSRSSSSSSRRRSSSRSSRSGGRRSSRSGRSGGRKF